MNIWILYYSILFLHISVLYNFICLIIFFYYSIKIYFLKYFFNYHQQTYKQNQFVGIFQRVIKTFTAHATITNGIIPSVMY